MTIHGTQAARSRQSGITLIEVMIAVLIFSIGLIGLAGLLVFATQSSHSAFLRTQATFLANNLGDRMRANPVGVWSDDYDSTAYPISGTLENCNASDPCDPAELADRDQVLWSNMLTALLPNSTAAVSCSEDDLSYVPNASQVAMRPPYGGACTLTITWSERGVTEDRAAAPQTFAWVFQP